MRASFVLVGVLVLVGLGGAESLADTPPAQSAATSCKVTVPNAAIVATFDGSMAGTITVDGAAGTRRFKIKSTPSAATYNLLFDGYGAGDQKPAAESLKSGKSVVARLVQFGDTPHLFFDSDYAFPGLKPSLDGLVCH